jgi:hypothetical protein
MSINASQGKLVDPDFGQYVAASADAAERALCAAEMPEDQAASGVADALAPALAEWLNRLHCWDTDLRARESSLEQQAAEVRARRNELAKDIRRHHHQSRAASATESIVAQMQQQLDQLAAVLLAVQDQPSRLPAASTEAGDDESTVAMLEQRIESLIEQNDQLASELAHNTIQRSVGQSSDASATLSWEQRKAMLYRQYESESTDQVGSATDADSSGRGSSSDNAGASTDLAELRKELASLQEILHHRNDEVAELRALLHNRSSVEDAAFQSDQLAVGAATFAKMFDDDELVRAERARLKELQTEWESKFRDMEIAASIERANLARERRELERQNAELEEQLAHLKQDLRQDSLVGPNQSRRWMAKLGLGE